MDTISVKERVTLETRFLKHVFKTDKGCWLWKLRPATSGHGRLKVNGKMVYAHRISYLLYCGDIPMGLVVCHRCDTGLCVNPEHLFLGTSRDNSIDLARKGLSGPQLKPEAYEGKRRFGKEIDPQIAQAILRSYMESKASQRSLARKFGVSKSYVNKLLTRALDAGEMENPNVGGDVASSTDRKHP